MESVTDKGPKPVAKVFTYIFLGFWAFVNIFPIYFMFTFSLKNNDEIFGSNVIGLPKQWIWSNYAAAMKTGNMWLYFLNSI
ncbi:MAG: carbohydrate ABC transporter permease, partial [Lachnospiraceae bacterium]|nr:carbohydrate ABC transporter permease [Lachnospiraceae bacterium]